MSIKEKKLKIADIAAEAGISEERARRIAEEHEDRIPSSKVGKVKTYSPSAVERFISILEEEEKDASPAENEQKEAGGSQKIAAIRERKAAKRVDAKSRPAESFTPARISEETVALQDQQLHRLFLRAESLEKSLDEQRRLYKEDSEMVQRQVSAQQEQIRVMDEWIRYYEGEIEYMKKPWWQKIGREQQ